MHGTVAYTFLNVCEKIRQFLSGIERDAHRRILAPFFCLTDGYMRVLFVHSFHCLGHFKNVYVDDDDDDRGGEQQGEPSGL